MTITASMAEALRLTRSGNLSAATDLLRSSLGGVTGGGAPRAASRGAVIDLVAERGRAALPASTGTLTKASYEGAAGKLGYLLYRPAGFAPGMPLVVMLHGCTQSPEDFARGTGMGRLADELGVVLAFPRQTGTANANKCWNWFRPGDQQRDGGEPALIAGMTRQIVAGEGIDATRVYVAGLSAGGAAAAIMAACYPDIYAAVGIHSGLAWCAAADLGGALAAMRNGAGAAARAADRFVPLITFHGDRDVTVNEINSRQIVAAAAARGVPLDTRADAGTGAGGRAYTRAVSRDPAGRALIEQWTIHGAGHAWSGGDPAGTYTDPHGPDASREMLRFFLEHRLG